MAARNDTLLPTRYLGGFGKLHSSLKGLRIRTSGVCVACRRADERARCRRVVQRVLMHYGGRCADCGHTEMQVLTFEHSDGQGAAHRRRLAGIDSGAGPGGYYVCADLIRRGFPPGYEVLCGNCNWPRFILSLRDQVTARRHPS